MIRSFFAVVVAAIGFGVGVQAVPSFEEGTRYARGGGLQIPIVNGLLSTSTRWSAISVASHLSICGKQYFPTESLL